MNSSRCQGFNRDFTAKGMVLPIGGDGDFLLRALKPVVGQARTTQFYKTELAPSQGTPVSYSFFGPNLRT